MLTRKQHELLMLIHDRLKETGVPPSFEEMKEALDLRSKSGIHRLITALEERGFIQPPAPPRPRPGSAEAAPQGQQRPGRTGQPARSKAIQPVSVIEGSRGKAGGGGARLPSRQLHQQSKCP